MSRIVNGVHISKKPNKILGEVKDIKGKQFNDLSVIEFDHKDDQGRAIWICKCICGHTRLVRENHLQTNTIKSCGFPDHQSRIRQLNKEKAAKAKKSNHPGILWMSDRNKYRITISIGHQKKKYIGQTDTLTKALVMQSKALKELDTKNKITVNHPTRHFNGIIGIDPQGKEHHFKNLKDARQKLNTKANIYRHIKNKKKFNRKSSKLYGWFFKYDQ